MTCPNCVANVRSFPCDECGAEPYKEHEDADCYHSSRSGVTISHNNAKLIGLNCNKTLNKVKTLGDNIDDLIRTISRVAHCSTEEAVETMISRARKFNHDEAEA